MPTEPISLRDLLNRGMSAATIEAASLGDAGTFAPERVVSTFRDAARAAVLDASLADLAGALSVIANPLQAATAFISAKYAALGGAAGFLGPSTTAVTVCPDGVGYFRHFQNGSIYWHPATGAHEVHGAIRGKWASLSWERGFLGYPTTDETIGGETQAAGRFSHFQNGSIYWHPSLGALEVHGAIREKYRALGAEASFLGYPTTDETGTPDGIGRFNHFQAGSIYWSPGTWAQEVHGLIRQYWADHGWERNPALGYPITDELIPDRRIGHVHPETARNPRLVPADVIRFPMMVDRTLGATVAADTATPAASEPVIARAVTANRLAVTEGTSPIGAVAFRPELAVLVALQTPSSTPAPERSRNRFGDFENGVLFWQRGSPVAAPLSPWRQSADGGQMSLSATEVADRVASFIKPVTSSLAGVGFAGISFAGTTGYSYDGVGVHNRRHRITLQLLGTQSISVFGGSFGVPAPAAVSLEVEAAFEPTQRKVIGMVTGWQLLSGQVDTDPPLVRQLHRILDPALWVEFDLFPIDDTEAGRPVAVLSVKTMSNGEVLVFIEPADRPLGSILMHGIDLGTLVAQPIAPVLPVPPHTTPVLVNPEVLAPIRTVAQPTIGTVIRRTAVSPPIL